LFALLACFAACGGSSSPSRPDALSVGGASLAIDRATSPATILNSAPPAGTSFVVIDLTLHNTSSTMPLPTAAPLFSLGTDHQLVLMTGAEEGSLAMPCTGSASVDVGGSLSCEVVYELPAGQQATTLRYDDAHGQSASAQVPAITAPDVCAVVSAYARVQSGSCISCFTSMCDTQYQNVMSSCSQSACTQCTSMTPDAKCACQKSCEPTACWNADEALYQCIADKCMVSCI